MGQLPCGFATATPALQKGRLPFTVLHFVWQSLFGSPATETAHGKSMVNPEFILSLSWVSWMFTSRCAFSKSPGESSFLTGAWWQIHGHKELDVTIDPGLAGIDHQELELMRSLADQWNKHTTAIRKKKDSLSQQLSLLKKILYKYGNAFKSHLSHLPVIVVGWKGYEIWVGQNDHCTELIYYIVMFLDVYIDSTAWSACGFVFV